MKKVEIYNRRKQRIEESVIEDMEKKGYRLACVSPNGNNPAHMLYKMYGFFVKDKEGKILDQMKKLEKAVKALERKVSKLSAPSKLGKKSKSGKKPKTATSDDTPEN